MILQNSLYLKRSWTNKPIAVPRLKAPRLALQTGQGMFLLQSHLLWTMLRRNQTRSGDGARSTCPSQNVQSTPAGFEVKSGKNEGHKCGACRTFGCRFAWRARRICTLPKAIKVWGFCSCFTYNHYYTTSSWQLNTITTRTTTTTTLHYIHYSHLHYTTLHYTSCTLHYTTLRYITLHYTYATLTATTTTTRTLLLCNTLR